MCLLVAGSNSHRTRLCVTIKTYLDLMTNDSISPSNCNVIRDEVSLADTYKEENISAITSASHSSHSSHKLRHNTSILIREVQHHPPHPTIQLHNITMSDDEYDYDYDDYANFFDSEDEIPEGLAEHVVRVPSPLTSP